MRAAYCLAALIVLTIGPRAAVRAQSLQFTDQTGAAGISVYQDSGVNHGDPKAYFGGGAAGDFNGDGWPDLFVLTSGAGLDRLYINNGNGTFTDQAALWGVARQHRGAGAVAGDIDNDGDLDLFVTSWGPTTAGGLTGQHLLYRNTGSSAFQEVASWAGVATTSPTIPDGYGAALGDYDLDGDLDLAVAGWYPNSGGNRLFRNNGAGQFTDVTASAILFDMNGVRGFSPRFADMDGDHYPELLWVADFGTSKYLVNNRDGTFSDATVSAGTGRDTNGMGNTIGDYDNDGDFDWYVSSIWYDFGTHFGNMLYWNQGSHAFVEGGTAAGVDYGGWGWGVVSVDFNHDGWPDILATNGWTSVYFNDPTRLFINQADGTFSEQAVASGINHTAEGRGLVNLDYDNDGDQDVVLFGFRQNVRLYRNDLSGPNTNWLRVLLDPRRVEGLPPAGIGSRVTVTVGGLTQVRLIDGGTNYCGNSEPSAHFGLGSAAFADVRVDWSNGAVSVLSAVPANQTLTIRAMPRSLLRQARPATNPP